MRSANQASPFTVSETRDGLVDLLRDEGRDKEAEAMMASVEPPDDSE